MHQPEVLDAAVVRAWARTTVEALAAARAELDRVNVFPVADGDTGTNMYLTARDAAAAVRAAPEATSGARLLRLAARAALLGARGNSGVILSEWLRGLTVAATRGDSLAIALDVAARTARQAVAHPAPGTILTAAESAAAAARHVEAGGMVGPPGAPARLSVTDAACRGAREAALRSVGALEPLRAAGVLDAGACGLVLVLEALAVAQRGAAEGASEGDGSMTPVLLDMDLRGHGGPVPADTGAHEAHAADGSGAVAADDVELMFVLERSASAVGFRPGAVADALRADLDDVGSSVVVVGGGDDGGDADAQRSLWQAHVHTSDLDAALDVARRWASRGAVSRVFVRHLAVPPDRWAVVVSTSAPALAAELARGGAVVVLDLDVRPTAEDLGAAALGAGAPRVLVLAPEALLPELRGPGLLSAGGEASGEASGGVPEVVPLAAPADAHLVAGTSALAAALDEGADDAEVPALVGAVVAGLRVATGPAVTVGAIVKRLVAGSPTAIVTLLPDDGVPEATTQMLAARAAQVSGGADVVVMRTGRPGDRVAIGVEPFAEDGAEAGR
ncbi:DAK2 domain-containing protein [Isoptericola sp. 4D.3]|uniref:DAK2 domain-containing protein n=1 Tax=Isoptericola peretonis TaxID=2918523 RepID=A0ABT0J0M1_9MICO|nr:DAK2 domain-containing protein [Isoptericola sp. 4D.3]